MSPADVFSMLTDPHAAIIELPDLILIDFLSSLLRLLFVIQCGFDGSIAEALSNSLLNSPLLPFLKSDKFNTFTYFHSFRSMSLIIWY